MAQWQVTQGDNQFPVADLEGLIALARKGDLSPGDLLQPPGASDWVYAVEVPDLQPHLPASDDDDLDYKSGGAGAMVPYAIMAALSLFIVLGLGGIALMIPLLPTGEERLVGYGGLSYSQMIVTADEQTLRDQPESDAKAFAGTAVPRDTVLELLARRGDWFKARSEGGVEGWIPVDAVIPLYQLGGEKVLKKFDPLYNPGHYVDVVNASWMEMPNPDPDPDAEKLTVFHFMFSNTSDYNMTDLVIATTIKDAKGTVLDVLEIPISGVIEAGGRTMVGTLQPEEEGGERVLLTESSFQKRSVNDPEMQERWTPGLETLMTVADFDNAHVDIIELRAIPDEEAAAAEAAARKN